MTSPTGSRRPAGSAGTEGRQEYGGGTAPIEAQLAREPVPKRTVLAWASWDWGSSAFNTVIVTFVFVTYLTGTVGRDIDGGKDQAATWLGVSTAIAGLIVALVAPIAGQRADHAGGKRRSVALWTAMTILMMLLMFFVKPERGSFLWGLILLAAGTVFIEFATVSYNAMITGISTPANMGRISGIGWAAGYFGGIVLLVISLLAFIGLGDGGGLLGISTDGALHVRSVMLLAAVWFAVFALPTLFGVPEPAGGTPKEKVSVTESYRRLFAQIKRLWVEERNTAKFLIASAIFRDGLNGIFQFGAVIAVTVYSIDRVEGGTNVIIFGIAANVTSALGAVVAGFLEDRVGPKRIILFSLGSMIVAGTILVFSYGPTAFWIFGLLLTLFVGPAQSSSRTFMARVTAPGHEGQMFGLYATTGRAVSFLAPALFAGFSAMFGAARAGTVGILLVLVAGGVALLFVRQPVFHRQTVERSELGSPESG